MTNLQQLATELKKLHSIMVADGTTTVNVTAARIVYQAQESFGRLCCNNAAAIVGLIEECERLEKIAGLRANPKIEAAIQQHLAEEYKRIKSDSCSSAAHKLYQTGDCVLGPAMVVEWSNKKQVWFTLEDGEVEIRTYYL